MIIIILIVIIKRMLMIIIMLKINGNIAIFLPQVISFLVVCQICLQGNLQGKKKPDRGTTSVHPKGKKGACEVSFAIRWMMATFL